MTRTRVVLAMTVAIAADGLQMLLGPLGWTFIDEIIDVAAMVIISLLVGFHPLLLPTFLLEFFPLVDMLPTWTGCTIALVLLRRHSDQQQRMEPRPPPIQPTVTASEPSGARPNAGWREIEDRKGS